MINVAAADGPARPPVAPVNRVLSKVLDIHNVYQQQPLHLLLWLVPEVQQQYQMPIILVKMQQLMPTGIVVK
jgi:hypothetical protein